MGGFVIFIFIIKNNILFDKTRVFISWFQFWHVRKLFCIFFTKIISDQTFENFHVRLATKPLKPWKKCLILSISLLFFIKKTTNENKQFSKITNLGISIWLNQKNLSSLGLWIWNDISISVGWFQITVIPSPLCKRIPLRLFDISVASEILFMFFQYIICKKEAKTWYMIYLIFKCRDI